jgi:hypothetical protein
LNNLQNDPFSKGCSVWGSLSFFYPGIPDLTIRLALIAGLSSNNTKIYQSRHKR